MKRPRPSLSSLCLSLSLSCLLCLLLARPAWVSGAGAPFCANLQDPWLASNPLAASQSGFYIYNYFGSIRYSEAQFGTFLSTRGNWNSRNAYQCATFTTPPSHPNAGQVVTANPSFARMLDVNNNVYAIGSPNRDLTFYPGVANGAARPYASSSYSNIELITFHLFNGAVGGVVSNVTLEDWNTPYLGSLISVSTPGSGTVGTPSHEMMAALYDPQSIAIYSPLTTRKRLFFNTAAGDMDVIVPLPAGGFLIDGMQLKSTPSGNSLLAVTGFTLSGSTCYPVLVIYTNSGAGWVMSSNLIPLRRVASPLDWSNTHPCPPEPGLPSGYLPVKVSDDLSTIIVAAPLLSTVWYDYRSNFTAGTPRFVFVSNPTPIQWGFGTQVDFSLSNGDEMNVLFPAINTIYTFPRANWNAYATSLGASYSTLNPLLFSSNVIPNRQQNLQTDSGPAQFVSFLAGPASILILTKPNPASRITPSFWDPIFAIYSTPPGFYYNSVLDTQLPCPTGTYKLTTGHQPCTFCPAGTYAPTTGTGVPCTPCPPLDSQGQANYCPTGSSAPIPAAVYAAPAPTYIPDFQAQTAAEVFEELLVNSIFARDSKTMICFYVLLCFTLSLVVVYWSTFLSFKIRMLALKALLFYRFVALPNELDQQRKELEKEIRKHLFVFGEDHDPRKAEQRLQMLKSGRNLHALIEQEREAEEHEKHEAEEAKEHGQPVKPSDPHSAVAVAPAPPAAGANHAPHLEHLHLNKEQEEAGELEDEVLEMEHHCDHIVCDGFFKTLLFLFCTSAILFSIIFLQTYDYTAVVDETNPINRYSYENLAALNSATDSIDVGLKQLAAINATITIDLLGFSGAPCAMASVLSLTLGGCTLLNSPLLCNDTSFISVTSGAAIGLPPSYLNAPGSQVCSVSVAIPADSSFDYPVAYGLALPPNVIIQAARISYLQSAQYALNLAYFDEYNISATIYQETITHPYTLVNNSYMILPDNYLQSPVKRQWNQGTIVNEHQDQVSTPPHYFATMLNTISATTLSPLFQTYSATQYATDSSSTSLSFQVIITADTYFRDQVSLRLIQPSVAFLTVTLGLIGIYHLVEFGQEMCELAWFVIKYVNAHVRKWSRRAGRWARKTTGIGPDIEEDSEDDEEEGGTGHGHGHGPGRHKSKRGHSVRGSGAIKKPAQTPRSQDAAPPAYAASGSSASSSSSSSTAVASSPTGSKPDEKPVTFHFPGAEQVEGPKSSVELAPVKSTSTSPEESKVNDVGLSLPADRGDSPLSPSSSPNNTLPSSLPPSFLPPVGGSHSRSSSGLYSANTKISSPSGPSTSTVTVAPKFANTFTEPEY